MVLPVAEKRLLADAVIVDSMVELQQNKEGKRDKTWTGEVDGREDELIASGVFENAVSYRW